MKNSTKLIAAAILGMCASLSHAEVYIGAAVGMGMVDTDISDFDDSTTFSVSGGYRFNENFALELGYVDLGDAEDDVDPVWTLEADGFTAAAVVIVPVTSGLEIFGKLGAFMWDATLSEAGFGEFANDDGTDVTIGVGVSYQVMQNFGLVAEYQYFTFDEDIDVGNLSIGARLIF